MLKKFKKIAFWLVSITLYLNIGWGLGYYYHYNIDTKTFESASWHAKLLGGHCAAFEKNEAVTKEAKEKSPSASEFVFSFLWPFILFASIVSWAVHIVFWILKFIFWGGLVRLIFGIS